MSPIEKTGDHSDERSSQSVRGKHLDDDKAKPLAEEVEEEMLDQDIPAETGIPPGTPERRK